MLRNKKGLVELWDTKKNVKHECNSNSAREILNNGEGRYVSLADWEASQDERRVAEKAEALLDKKAEKKLEKTEVEDLVGEDLVAAHNKIVDEKVEGDDRLTATGAVKLSVLSEALGRDVPRQEHTAYVRSLTELKKSSK